MLQGIEEGRGGVLWWVKCWLDSAGDVPVGGRKDFSIYTYYVLLLHLNLQLNAVSFVVYFLLVTFVSQTPLVIVSHPSNSTQTLIYMVTRFISLGWMEE